jgi:hypothetical protein
MVGKQLSNTHLLFLNIDINHFYSNRLEGNISNFILMVCNPTSNIWVKT